MAGLTIIRAGALTTVQDLGRAHQRRAGVSLGGALDLHAARVANLLVGNPETAALLEITLGSARFRFPDDRLIAWCGGEFLFETGGETIPAGHRCHIRSGEELEIAPAGCGCRAWVAISGGIDTPPVLESRATDLRAGFGGWEGRTLRDSDELPMGQSSMLPETTARVSSWSAPIDWSQTASERPILRVVPGPEWEEFGVESRAMFLNERFTVSPKCDRMGARLEGVALRREKPEERLSETVASGTIQVPNDGQSIILLGDCQTIGGYPRIGSVITVDLSIAAQLRPNDSVRFREVTRAEAVTLFVERENDLQRFRVGLRLRAA
ncbi:MAG: biotin-dependent carboxyltransferase family protein [Chthoniobacterales bacterium]|jgi:antagonist of KipI